jgi:Ner family transcriptional regulator
MTPLNERSISQDWNPWDIKAALGKKGYTLTRVALENGFCRTSPSESFRKPWPKMERIIADVIGMEPWDIWPSRYDDNHKPLRMHGTCRTY